MLPEILVVVAPTGMQILPDLFRIRHPGAGATWMLERDMDGFNAFIEMPSLP
jgi:hypothetical protein